MTFIFSISGDKHFMIIYMFPYLLFQVGSVAYSKNESGCFKFLFATGSSHLKDPF